MIRASYTLRAATAIAISAALGGPAAAGAQEDGGLPAIESHTAGFERLDGFFPLYWDDDAGTLWLEIGRLGVEVLYVNALAAGVGSNDIGLDRGQLGGTRIVRFERVGRKILMVQPNYAYRADTSNPDERRAVEDAFATSILFGFTAVARTDDRFLVDATPFLLRDVHGVADRLPGAYRLDARRSAVHLARTMAFPENTEMEATLTFARESRGDGPGFGRGSIDAVTPSAEAVTVRQRQSFIALPDDGYTPRAYDPRAGYGAVSYVDYAAPARRADDPALPAPASPAEARPGRGDQRGGRTDRLLPGPGHAGADPLGAAGRRALVEPGVRGGRIPGRLPRGADAGRGRSARRALQRHPVGAPLHARLELRQLGDRSAHGRDHQGTRHARFPARQAGLPHRRGTALALSPR